MANDTGPKLGLKAAVEKAQEETRELRQAEQLALLPLAADDGEPAEDGGQAPRGRGRPKGARNRRTEEMVDYLLSRHTSPLEFLATVYTRPVEVLAAEVECSKREALAMQIAAAEKLAPYLHQRQPTAVELDAKGEVHLVIGSLDGGQAVAAGDGAVVIEGVFEDGDENG